MTTEITFWLLVGAVGPSFLTCYLAVFLLRRWAPRLGLVDAPLEARKVHKIATPLGGGLGIWLGVVTPFAVGQLFLFLVLRNPSGPLAELVPRFALAHLDGLAAQSFSLWVLLGAATILMLIGLADDRWGLPWQARLGAQFALAAGCVLWQQWRLTAFIPTPGLATLLSVIWIVALVNSFNMLDNMDCLSAGVAAIAAAILAAVLLLSPGAQPQLFVAGLLLVLVGAMLGFLVHNRPPARIFMGDAGSYFVGFLIAIATLLATYTGYHSSKQHAVLAPLCVMAVPLYDMTTVLWIRIRSGRSLFQADKNHFSHRLVDLGLTKGQAVLTIYLTTATCGLGALLLPRVDAYGAGIVVLMIGCVLSLIAILESTARRMLRGR